MASDNELVRLEKYIEKLMAGYSALKADKQRIEKQLVEVQAENEKIKQELNSFDSERGVMRDRVNSLIDQIEQWEAEIDSEAATAVDDTEEEDGEEEESEEEEPPAEEKPKSKRGAKAQKNLFSGD